MNIDDSFDTPDSNKTPEAFNALPTLFKHISEEAFNNEIATDAAKYEIPGLTRPEATTFDADADKHVDYFKPKQEHNPKWDQYDSSDYADYETYHSDDMALLFGEWGASIKHPRPTDILNDANRVFAIAGLRPIERSELPNFPKDNDAIKGWDMKWIRKHEFARALLWDWISCLENNSYLSDPRTQVRIRAMHTKILLLAKENAKLANKAPEGHAITLGYYEDPATTEKISTPPNATTYLALHITLKNAHRGLLADVNYRDRYIAAKGVICHCCGTPNEAATNWPVAGVKLISYHSGAGNAPCRACRNAIDSVLAGTGVYRVLPSKYQAKIDSIIAELVGAGNVTTAASLSDSKQYLVAQIIKAGREEAHIVAKNNTDSVDDLKAMMDELAELKRSA